MRIIFAIFSITIMFASLYEARLGLQARSDKTSESFEELPKSKQTEINYLLELYSVIETPRDFLNKFFQGSGNDLEKRSWVCIAGDLNRFEVLFDEWGMNEIQSNNPMLTFDFRYHLHLTDGTKCSNKYLNSLYQKYNLETIHVPKKARI